MGKGVFLNVSAPGHVIPTLGLVVELVARGEEIAYFEVPPFQAEIEAFGAAFRPYPAIRPYPGPGGANQYYLAPVSAWCALEWVPQLLERVRAERPDYIVHDSLCLWGRIIAHVLDVPAVASVATAGFCAASFHGCPILRPRRRMMIAEARAGLRLFRDWRRELQSTYRLPRPISLVDVFSNPQPLNIVYLPRALQPYAEKFNGEHAFVGACTPARANAATFPFERLDGRPLVYVSFGTIHNPGLAFFQACVAALGGADAQVVLVLSPGVTAAELGDVPENFFVLPTGTAPQLRLLERAAVFITHGGGGGMREGAWQGVPMIAVPQTYEQEILSARLAEQGAGLMLEPADVTPATVHASVERVLAGETFRARARELAVESRAAGGAARAADAVLRYAERSRR
jgi:MGT family glycosyltransferase